MALTEVQGKAWTTVAEFNLLDATGAVVDRKGWTASADSADVNDPPGSAIDGNTGSVWHTRWQGEAPPPPHELIVKLPAATRVTGFRVLPRQDALINGTIARWRFYVSDDGQDWGAPVASGDFSEGGDPKQEKTVVFAEQRANRPPVVQPLAAQHTPLNEPVSVPVAATDPDGDVLSYSAEGLPPGVTISSSSGLISGTPVALGFNSVKVTANDNKGMQSVIAFQWEVQAPVAIGAKAAPGEVRFVKLEEVAEINGKPWASVAEFNLIDAKGSNLPREGWIASADSADTSDKPANAIDGNPATLWHSQWDGASPPPPHSLVVDLRRYTRVAGFRVLPRQDKLTNGIITRWRFYTSVDGVQWGPPVAEGDFSTMGKTATEKTVWLR